MATKVKSTLTGTHIARSGKFRRIITCMTDNPYFREPWLSGLSLVILIAAADKYDKYIFAGSRGDRDNIATRNEVFQEVQALVHRLAHYVELVAGDNWEALRSSGFELRRQPRRATHATSDVNLENMLQPAAS
jgi:hypothetical protein